MEQETTMTRLLLPLPTPRTTNGGLRQTEEKGPRDIVNDISWSVGKFFLVHFIFLLLTMF